MGMKKMSRTPVMRARPAHTAPNSSSQRRSGARFAGPICRQIAPPSASRHVDRDDRPRPLAPLAPHRAPDPLDPRGAQGPDHAPGDEGDSDEGAPSAREDPTRRVVELM